MRTGDLVQEVDADDELTADEVIDEVTDESIDALVEQLLELAADPAKRAQVAESVEKKRATVNSIDELETWLRRQIARAQEAAA